MDEFITPTVQVGQLFAHPYFIEAPVYQRSFAWTEKEVCHLLDEVATAVDGAPGTRDGSDYFLGTMLFIERDQRHVDYHTIRTQSQYRCRRPGCPGSDHCGEQDTAAAIDGSADLPEGQPC